MDEIVIVEHDPRWAGLFAEEAERIRAAFPHQGVTRIEHFGSTAVPTLPAKPIIDILIGVESLADAIHTMVPVLESWGYSWWYDNPRRDVLFLVKGLPPNEPRTHHLHIVEADSDLWDRLLFRDYLRAHPDEAARYADLKRDLAAQFQTDREAYTDAKGQYIARVMALAKGEMRD